MIFAVLEDWYHHIVLTHSCKLVSFLHIYLLFYCQKSGNEPDTCKKRYSRIRIFTFYFSNTAVYFQSGTKCWMCLLLLLLLLRCYSLYVETRVGCGRLWMTSSNYQTFNPLPSIRCKDFDDICCASRGIAHCVSNYGNKGRWGGMWLVESSGPSPKTKIKRIFFTKTEL